MDDGSMKYGLSVHLTLMLVTRFFVVKLHTLTRLQSCCRF